MLIKIKYVTNQIYLTLLNNNLIIYFFTINYNVTAYIKIIHPTTV